MRDTKIEDTVLVLDVSRSMLRIGLKHSKLTKLIIMLQAAKNFIEYKFLIDPKDRISIISFGKTTKKLSEYSYDENSLINSLKKTKISGKGNFEEAIAFSLQLIVQEMRKIGDKIQRIVIICDKIIKSDSNRLGKIVNIAKGLGVYIDICQMGKPNFTKQNLLKKLAQQTNGEYGYFNNFKALINSCGEFAAKKVIKTTIDYRTSEKKDKKPPLMSEIALSLRRPTMMEIRLMMSKSVKEQEICQICHSTNAITGADFFTEGRYCPNCDRAMHLSCAAMWAKKSEFNRNVFRCPFCFFLLEVPKSVVKLVENLVSESQKIKIIEEKEVLRTKMIEMDEESVNKIDASCSYCHSIFLGDFKVYKCENCESYYHEPCLQKMLNEMKACRFCGAEILQN